MADIDQIIAGGAGASSRADFSGVDGAIKTYWDTKDQRAKNDLRDAFKDGVPTTADGQPDFSAMAKTLFQKGGLAEGTALTAAAIGPSERAKLDGIDSPPTQSNIVSPPSSNRGASVPVAPALNRGGETGSGSPQGTPQGGPQGGATVMKILAAQGIPNDQLGAASASIARQLGVDPTAPIDLNDPQVRNVLAPAVAQLKRSGIGQVQPPQPGDNPPQGQPPQAPPQMAQAQPQPQAPQDDQILKRLTLLAASPDKATAAAAQTRLKSYLASKEPTPEMKNAAASGQTLPAYQESQGEMKGQEAGAVERAKSYVAKYDNINEAGDKAVSEIPKLHLALKQMDDPNYYSGPFNQYNLNAKRLVAALGGDPDKAAPQEIVNKITADSILSGMGALKGLGPIRVAEMKILGQASMSPDNSIEAQKFLANMAIRVQERVAKVSDIAQNYNEGILDNGFDKKIRAEDRANPLFSQAEIDRFQKILQGKEKAAPQQTNAPGAPQRFSSPADVHAAVAAGKLQKGQTFVDGNGKTRIVP